MGFANKFDSLLEKFLYLTVPSFMEQKRTDWGGDEKDKLFPQEHLNTRKKVLKFLILRFFFFKIKIAFQMSLSPPMPYLSRQILPSLLLQRIVCHRSNHQLNTQELYKLMSFKTTTTRKLILYVPSTSFPTGYRNRTQINNYIN